MSDYDKESGTEDVGCGIPGQDADSRTFIERQGAASEARDAPRTVTRAAPARKRPLGVTVLAVLAAIGGLITLLGAAGMFAISGYASSGNWPSGFRESMPQWFTELSPMAINGTGVLMIVMGLLYLAVAWTFLKGRGWGRALAIALLAISVIINIATVALEAINSSFNASSAGSVLLSIIISAAIIWYLTTSHVRSWFNADRRVGVNEASYIPGLGRK